MKGDRFQLTTVFGDRNQDGKLDVTVTAGVDVPFDGKDELVSVSFGPINVPTDQAEAAAQFLFGMAMKMLPLAL